MLESSIKVPQKGYFTPFLHLMPSDALRTPISEVLILLEGHFGASFYNAFDLQTGVESPCHHLNDTNWLKEANCVGVNVRTIGSFWHLVPYAMTLPHSQNSIHILPIWEPGVVASLYGMSSWNINPEFFSAELAALFPHLDTVEKQLQVVINLLHLLGKTVGMDVVPHTDRYAEQVLANPRFFEWLQREDMVISRHNSLLYNDAAALIFYCLQNMGSAVDDLPIPDTADGFFSAAIPEETRLEILFGKPHDYQGRLDRRKVFVQWLYDNGFETVPATMAPPYRGIAVDPAPTAKVVDEAGRVWRDYRIIHPEPMSRVFGPLARYRLYESKNDNQDWELDFTQPVNDTWAYACGHYARIQAAYNFDFMRGDMSHVQMRPDGVPAHPDKFYDLLGAVKRIVQYEKPYFGYFAESFLAPAGHMAYGDECDHLEASLADSTLGDLQSEIVGTQKFVADFAQYRYWLDHRTFAPNFTIMTADKDDPRFDPFYVKGNEIRYFIALFLTDMPSYMGLGFECRDTHLEPAPNEHYTKLYVFQVKEGPKSTDGPFLWGQNRRLYAKLARQKEFSNQIDAQIAGSKIEWLLPPDPAGIQKTIAWHPVQDPNLVFVANFNTEDPVTCSFNAGTKGHILFSTEEEMPAANRIIWQNGQLQITVLQPGEGLVIRLED